MRRLIVSALILAGALPLVANAQVPNGISGSFTSVLNTESPQTILLSTTNNNGTIVIAGFLYSFTVSDSCRVVFHHSTTDAMYKSNHDPSVIGVFNDYVIDYIPLSAGVVYNIEVNATSMTLYRAGPSVTISYKGIVEYED